jgi:hypothetical protein
MVGRSKILINVLHYSSENIELWFTNFEKAIAIYSPHLFFDFHRRNGLSCYYIFRATGGNLVIEGK